MTAIPLFLYFSIFLFFMSLDSDMKSCIFCHDIFNVTFYIFLSSVSIFVMYIKIFYNFLFLVKVKIFLSCHKRKPINFILCLVMII